ncbi:hypothetical protein Tco_0408596 [Tanacetum coccineum]
MMTITTAFIRGETAVASKKKGHAPRKPQDQAKRHVFERKSDFRGDPEGHVKIFQAAAQVERWAMPTWCHMFNNTLIGTARQKKYIKDPVEIYNIKQRDGETIEDFMERFKVETGRMKRAPECIEAEVRHENLKVALHPNFPDQEVAIGETISVKGRTKLCSLLKENLDIFAWQLADITGVPRSVAKDRLNIREGYPPVR